MRSRSCSESAQSLPAIAGLSREATPVEFTQLFLFNSWVIVETALPKLNVIILLALNPKDNCD
jgi:hypothetical protein